MQINKDVMACKNLGTEVVIEGSRLFSDDTLKKALKITLFEKFCLWFIKAEYHINEGQTHTTRYKIFRGKMYILKTWINPPKHWSCRSWEVSLNK